MYTAIMQLFTSTPFLYWCKIQYDFTLFCSLHIFITRSTEQQTRTKIKHKRDGFLRPAHTFRKASLSPWFSDNCYILFKVEALRGLKKKKNKGPRKSLQIYIDTRINKHHVKTWNINRNISPGCYTSDRSGVKL